MNDRGRVRHWSAYVFGVIGSQDLDDFGEAIRSPCITPVEVRQLTQAMADRARAYFADDVDAERDGDGGNGEQAARGMLDGADSEIAGLHHERAPRAGRTGVRSASLGEDATAPIALVA